MGVRGCVAGQEVSINLGAKRLNDMTNMVQAIQVVKQVLIVGIIFVKISEHAQMFSVTD